MLQDILKGYGLKIGAQSRDTLRLIELGELSLNGNTVDFHVSLCSSMKEGEKTIYNDTTGKYCHTIHFAVRADNLGQGAVIYWWYELRRQLNGTLVWHFSGKQGGGTATVGPLIAGNAKDSSISYDANTLLGMMLKKLQGKTLAKKKNMWTVE
jgi:hypothetical protein